MAIIEMDHCKEFIIVYKMVNGIIITYRKEGREIGVGKICRFLEIKIILNRVEGLYNI